MFCSDWCGLLATLGGMADAGAALTRNPLTSG